MTHPVEFERIQRRREAAAIEAAAENGPRSPEPSGPFVFGIRYWFLVICTCALASMLFMAQISIFAFFRGGLGAGSIGEIVADMLAAMFWGLLVGSFVWLPVALVGGIVLFPLWGTIGRILTDRGATIRFAVMISTLVSSIIGALFPRIVFAAIAAMSGDSLETSWVGVISGSWVYLLPSVIAGLMASAALYRSGATN
ncbi:MAG: hypothetical protein ACU0BS_14285 [Hasllibacter sp.]